MIRSSPANASTSPPLARVVIGSSKQLLLGLLPDAGTKRSSLAASSPAVKPAATSPARPPSRQDARGRVHLSKRRCSTRLHLQRALRDEGLTRKRVSTASEENSSPMAGAGKQTQAALAPGGSSDRKFCQTTTIRAHQRWSETVATSARLRPERRMPGQRQQTAATDKPVRLAPSAADSHRITQIPGVCNGRFRIPGDTISELGGRIERPPPIDRLTTNAGVIVCLAWVSLQWN